MKKSFLISIIVAALLLSGLIFILNHQDSRYDLLPLLIGNVLLAVLALVSYSLTQKGLAAGSGHALLRAKYTSLLLKFGVGLGAFFGYLFYVGKDNVHRPILFLFLGMYVVYAALEAVPLSKSARKK